MSTRDDILAAKKRFLDSGANSIQAAHLGACQGSATALESLVALRQALPSPFRDFVEFERSRVWRRKDAIAVFDRALKAVQS